MKIKQIAMIKVDSLYASVNHTIPPMKIIAPKLMSQTKKNKKANERNQDLAPSSGVVAALVTII